MTHINTFECRDTVVIPDFPIALRSFVFLINQNSTKSNDLDINSHELNHPIHNPVIDGDNEFLSLEFDEDIMFGRDQPNFIIGKYNEVSICSFGQNYSTN